MRRSSGGERDPARPRRTIGARGQLAGPGLRGLRQARARHHLVHEPPLHRALALDALLERAEEVGAVAPHPPLVHQPREAAGPRQHREQRHLGQRHGGGAVVGHDDPVGGQRQLVAAARAGPVHRGEPDLARARGRVLDRAPRLVGELAEVHLPAVGGLAQHPDVGARAEDPLLAGGEDDRADLGMLEAQALDGVVELDVHAQVVGVELELVAGHEAAVLLDVHGERGHRAVEGELPVPVPARVRPEIDHHARAVAHHLSSSRGSPTAPWRSWIPRSPSRAWCRRRDRRCRRPRARGCHRCTARPPCPR